ncbi:MAG: DsrE/DsrF/DrsH-like family protein [Elusimicrobia bacterium]|nr:DsrE/DsrF/DrsH-like family protein [Elusimicrobiota bacterium]
MAENNKLSIICMSGDFDKAIAAFTLASGAAAVNYEVNIFFTFWGLNNIKKKKGRSFIGNGLLARAFNFLLGGRNNLPLSRLNFAGASPRLMTGLMKKRNVATLQELFQASLELGVNFYACEMAMHILGLTKDDFIPEVKGVLGVVKFLELSKGGQTLFL